MTEKNETPGTLTTEPPVFRSPDYRIVFSNLSRLRVSPTEFAITFGYLDAIPVAGTPLNTSVALNATEDRTSIILTPHHAKILALNLQGAIAAYEREYGKIDVALKPPLGIDKLMAAVKEKFDEAS
jgi:Protein of unknown function (DUF3467)